MVESAQKQSEIIPKYITKSPFRFVEKYDYTYFTYVKKRWLNRQLLDVWKDEFIYLPNDYYREAVKQGILTVNKKIISEDYILKDGDYIKHTLQKVETPVLNLEPKIIFEDENYLVFSKPPDILVHGHSDQYFNTMQHYIKYGMGITQDLNIIHRLDKVTSGILIFSKKKMSNQNEHSDVFKQKVYLARVKGNVQFEEQEVKVHMYCQDYKSLTYKVYEGEDQKEIEKLQAKYSETKFKKLWYDEESDTSLLEVYPLTGKTHQIRVHASYLGYPIINDIKYGGEFVGNFIIKQHFPEIWEDENIQFVSYCDNKVLIGNENEIDKATIQFETKKNDFRNNPLEICLHSYRYQIDQNIFQDQEPYWANKNFKFK